MTNVQVYAWSDHGIADKLATIEPTFIVGPRHGTSPGRAVAHLMTRARSLNRMSGPIRPWFEEYPRGSKRPYYDYTGPGDLIANGPFEKYAWEWWRDFLYTLAKSGFKPTYFVFDHEEQQGPPRRGMTLWSIPGGERPAWFASLAANKRAMRRLPRACHAFVRSGGDFRRHREGLIAYNAWALDWKSDALRKMIVRRFRAMFNYTVAATNYDDHRPSFPVHDWNGWPMTEVSLRGRSAPVCYFYNPPADRPLFKGSEKHPRWNQIVKILNSIRSCAARGPVNPWIPPPGYVSLAKPHWAADRDIENERLLWEVVVAQIFAHGIDEMILFNPDNDPRAAENIRWMDEFFSQDHGIPRLQTNLPEIPFDADEIVTGDLVTRYKDVLPLLGG